MKDDIFKDIKILDYIEKVGFETIEKKSYNCKPKDFKEIFGTLVCYISSKETFLVKKNVDINEKESNYDSEVNDESVPIFFQISIKFKTYKSFIKFREKFEEYYESSKKSYFFWLNVKAKFNEEMCDRYKNNIDLLAEELNSIKSYHIKND